jgi:hypothetical protein
MIDLNGKTMFVSSTAAAGVVSGSTRLHFQQRGERVFARYAGGSVARGCLVGRWRNDELTFRYAQVEDGKVHAGRSVCDVHLLENHTVRILENFVWTTRPGSGTNVFDEVPGSR